MLQTVYILWTWMQTVFARNMTGWDWLECACVYIYFIYTCIYTALHVYYVHKCFAYRAVCNLSLFWLYTFYSNKWWWADLLILQHTLNNLQYTSCCHRELWLKLFKVFYCLFLCVYRWSTSEEKEGACAEDAGQRGVQRVWWQGLWFPLQRVELRGLQGLLSTQRHQKCPVQLQEQRPLWNGHVHAAQMPAVPPAQV